LIAKKFKGARWALLKNPGDLSDPQAATLAGIRRHGGAMWRAYLLKEALRAVFDGDLEETMELLNRWCSRAQRSRLAPFVKAAATVLNHRDGILATIEREPVQRSDRRAEQQSPPEHPTRLRISLSRSRPRAGDALLRAHRTSPLPHEKRA
jgi:pyridoxine/pyridoxamine 5'-phosphate oxidase